jgi:hypothetical protein
MRATDEGLERLFSSRDASGEGAPTALRAASSNFDAIALPGGRVEVFSGTAAPECAAGGR